MRRLLAQVSARRICAMEGLRRVTNCRWVQQGLNLRPSGYEPPALTTELWTLAETIIAYWLSLGKGGYSTGTPTQIRDVCYNRKTHGSADPARHVAGRRKEVSDS